MDALLPRNEAASAGAHPAAQDAAVQGHEQQQHVSQAESEHEQLGYFLALGEDNLLVALDCTSGEQLACFTLDSPEQAADPDFLSFVRLSMRQALGPAWPSSNTSANSPELLQHSSQSVPPDLHSDAKLQPPAHAFTERGCPAAAPEPDWVLAAALQLEEDAGWAAAEAARDEEAAAAAARHALLLSQADEQLARQWQQDEDAGLAAALGAQQRREQEAISAEVAAWSGSVWSRLHSKAPTSAAALNPPPALPAQPHSSYSMRMKGAPAGAPPPPSPDPFPALHSASTAAPGASSGSSSLSELLRSQHRSAGMAALEQRSGGTHLLHRSSSPALSPQRLRPLGRGPPPLSPGSASWTAGTEAGGSGVGPAADAVGGYLAPLQLAAGLRLHEDDLHYQLLLKDDAVSAAAKAAAEAYAQRAEVAAAAGGASASTAAMRSMIDAAARSRSGSRPGSAAAIRYGGGGLGQAEAAAVGMSQPAAAAAAAPEEEEEEEEEVQVRPVDTKSLRRLMDDMRSRGWQFMPEVSSGHLRCQRTFPDLPGKQVYFLCCTPSDVNYIWNVAAAVKRFDRQYLEMKKVAAAAAQQTDGTGAGSIGTFSRGRRQRWSRNEG